jgi:hypothetical protein
MSIQPIPPSIEIKPTDDFFSIVPVEIKKLVVGFLSLQDIARFTRCCKKLFQELVKNGTVVEIVLARDYAINLFPNISASDQLHLLTVTINYIRKNYYVLSDSVTKGKAKKEISLPLKVKLSPEEIGSVTLDAEGNLILDNQLINVTHSRSELNSKKRKFKEITFSSGLDMASIDANNEVHFFRLYENRISFMTPSIHIDCSVAIPKNSLVAKIPYSSEKPIIFSFENAKMIVKQFFDSLIPAKLPYLIPEGFDEIFLNDDTDNTNMESFNDFVGFLEELYPIENYPLLYENEEDNDQDANLTFCQSVFNRIDSIYSMNLKNSSSQDDEDDLFCQALLTKLFRSPFYTGEIINDVGTTYEDIKYSEAISYEDIIYVLYPKNLFACRQLSRSPPFLKKMIEEEMHKFLKDNVEFLEGADSNSYPEYAFDAFILHENFFKKCNIQVNLFALRRQVIIAVINRLS